MWVYFDFERRINFLRMMKFTEFKHCIEWQKKCQLAGLKLAWGLILLINDTKTNSDYTSFRLFRSNSLKKLKKLKIIGIKTNKRHTRNEQILTVLQDHTIHIKNLQNNIHISRLSFKSSPFHWKLKFKDNGLFCCIFWL